MYMCPSKNLTRKFLDAYDERTKTLTTLILTNELKYIFKGTQLYQGHQAVINTI